MIDIIKMDIEGHEPHALKGCMALIRKHNPILFTEFNPRCLVALDHDPMDYLEQMFTIYHRMHVITAWSDSAEFDEPKSIMAYWKRRNMELTTDGTLPDGMLHFDTLPRIDSYYQRVRWPNAPGDPSLKTHVWSVPGTPYPTPWANSGKPENQKRAGIAAGARPAGTPRAQASTATGPQEKGR